MLRWGIASMSLGSAVIHASVVPDHAGLPLHLAFFLVTAAVQSVLAAVVLRSRSGPWLALTAACNGLIAVVWMLSRTTGLPIDGAAAVEPIGFKDAISTLFEIGVVVGAGLVAVLPEASRRVSLGADSLASTMIAVTVWGLAVAGLVARHTHDDPAHLHGRGVEGAVEWHHPATGLAQRDDHDEGVLAAAHQAHGDARDAEAEVIHLGHHPWAPGLDADHQDHARAAYIGDRTVGRGHNHHHDAASEAFGDDGTAPTPSEPEHAHRHAVAFADTDSDGHEHRHESGSEDHRTGGGHDPDDSGRGPAGRLIDDVIRMLGSN
jgi:hypothetical protein